MTIGIIDYGIGNLRSVQKALQQVGAEAKILGAPSDISNIDKVILPGVGAFADGMRFLREMGWIDCVRTFIDSGKPFMGTCLGMQLLFDSSEEDATSPDNPVEGLHILPGRVVQFRQPEPPSPRIKIPHMGWNTLSMDLENPLFSGLKQEDAVYFVHSFYCQPDDPSLVAASCEYPTGRLFCAAARRGNIFATQFHPEKSQHVGLRMLANFVRL